MKRAMAIFMIWLTACAPEQGGVGAVCETDRDCAGEMLCDDDLGQCTVACDSSDGCEAGVCLPVGLCVAPCELDRDCPEGTRCEADLGWCRR